MLLTSKTPLDDQSNYIPALPEGNLSDIFLSKKEDEPWKHFYKCSEYYLKVHEIPVVHNKQPLLPIKNILYFTKERSASF